MEASVRTRQAALAAVSVFVASVLLATVTTGVVAQTPAEQFEQACASGNPYFVTTCFARGSEWDEPALVAFQDTRNNSGHVVLATMRQLGSAYGVAYQPEEKAIYAAAYHKRGSPFAPSGGPGSIYRIDLTSGAIGQWVEVPKAGRDQHDRTDGYFPDTRARNIVGNVGLGDVDLNEDGTELYVTNLGDRRIYRYRLADRSLISTIAHGAAGEGWASQARPFGLKFWHGKLYHGVVNTAYQSQSRGDLRAYVYESDPDGSNMRLATQFSLDYGRGNVFGNVPARWWPWKDGYNATRPGPLGAYPQPMLTDIEFADSGDMVLGLRDRNGDMTFFDPGGRNPPGEGTSIPAGDILLARFNGGTWDTATTPEHFAQDGGPGVGTVNGTHDESSFGGLARMMRRDMVVNTGLAPERISSGGAFWYEIGSGKNTAREEIYNYKSEVNYGKANGLGDVEILCGAPARPTPTPTSTDTPPPTAPTSPYSTSTTTPSSTASVTASATASVPATATSTATPRRPTLTPGGPPTATPTAAPPSPTATQAPPQPSPTPHRASATPTEKSPRREATTAPSPTRVVPHLPKTGAADNTGWGLVAAGLFMLFLGVLRHRPATRAR